MCGGSSGDVVGPGQLAEALAVFPIADQSGTVGVRVPVSTISRTAELIA